ncbi:hypothetical protein HG535_0D01250 [Zygotorulaspora mrakii]|uniref:Nodulin-like domain-containing protein n=1 Tax=Zygotorulaspora mrakii TaxID=42260 RepID=A0A7H9B1Q0_ZYGMR|nr:uncharacterized protein HG535_0D01250 [Zygotorulaspora mrakii]QLG72417.1 hypothetical protein HG535_0D01250 [Zygotorulaspora mrakii]
MRPPSRSEQATCFVGSGIVALGAGTPYLLSFYAPQLLAKCNLPVSNLSTLSLAMSLGSSLLGFFAGIVIDKSVAGSCLIGALCTFSAYSILHYCYVHELANVPLIAFGLTLVGFGSVSGFYAAVKCCTTNFPHHRGTAGAFPVALYALAGMLFSTICTEVFGDDVEGIFKFLTYVCSSMIFVGCWTMKIMVTPKARKVKRRNSSIDQQVPNSRGSNSNMSETPSTQPIMISSERQGNEIPHSFPVHSQNRNGSLSSTSSSSLASSFQSLWSNKRSDSFIWSKDLPGSLSFWGWGRVRDEDALSESPSAHPFPPPSMPQLPPLSRTRQSYSSTNSSPRRQRFDSFTNLDRTDSFKRDQPGAHVLQRGTNNEVFTNMEDSTRNSIYKESSSWKNSHVFRTMKKPRFILYFIILATLQGIGQMYIFSVGFIVQTQVYSTSPEKYKLNPESIQSLQVSIISILSFLGRLSSGPFSDLLVKKLKAQRLWNIVVAGILFVYASLQMLQVSHVNLSAIMEGPDNIKNISFCSALFGYGFGILFGTFPSIIADAFGTEGFSTIWGLSTSGGLFTVKYFCSVLGVDLQNHVEDGKKYCEKGTVCYSHTFHLTAFFAMLVTVFTLAVITVSFWERKHRHELMPDSHHVEYLLTEEDENEEHEGSTQV